MKNLIFTLFLLLITSNCFAYKAFFQLYDTHTENDIHNMFLVLKENDINHLIVQWISYNNQPFFWQLEKDRYDAPFKYFDMNTKHIDIIFDLSIKYDIDLEIGLVYDESFWSMSNRNEDVVNVYLNRLYRENTSIINSILLKYREHEKLKGFYIPQEIDDMTWNQNTHLMYNYINNVKQYLNDKYYYGELSISFFLNGWISPQKYSEFIDSFFVNSNIDKIYIQDSIGSEKMKLHESEYYISNINHNEKIYIILEIFDDKYKYAPEDRIKSQYNMISKYTDNIILFSINNIMER